MKIEVKVKYIPENANEFRLFKERNALIDEYTGKEMMYKELIDGFDSEVFHVHLGKCRSVNILCKKINEWSIFMGRLFKDVYAKKVKNG